MKEQIKTRRCELSGDFAGIWIDIRTNPPMRVYEDLISGDLARVYAALATMTRATNLTDEHDQPLDLSTVAGWREVSLELISETATQIKAALAFPKGSSNGSPTSSPSAAEPSLVSTS